MAVCVNALSICFKHANSARRAMRPSYAEKFRLTAQAPLRRA
jgi:hypothetical protein